MVKQNRKEKRRSLAVFTPIVPYPPDSGSRRRFFHIIELLSKNNRLTVAAFINSDHDKLKLDELSKVLVLETVPIFIKKSRLLKIISYIYRFLLLISLQKPIIIYKKTLNQLRNILLGEKFDFIISAHTAMTVYLYNIDFIDPGKVILDEACLYHLYYYRMYSKVYNWYNPMKIISLIRYARLKKFEERVLKKFVYCTAPSSKEAAVLRKMSPNSVVIEAPNGVDLDHFRMQPLVRNSLDLLFTGDLSYMPNLDAVKWFISRVIPLIKEECPNVRILHIGKGGELLDKFSKNIYQDSYFSMGYQENISDILKRSSIFINPMRSGAGVRLKVLEAMALGKAVISTSIGAEGINISDDAVIIADTPEDMAREIINIIQDLKTDCRRIKRITALARKIVEEHYSWNNTLKGIIDIIDSKKGC